MRALNPGWAGRADLILFSESRDKKKNFFWRDDRIARTCMCHTPTASLPDLPPVAYAMVLRSKEGRVAHSSVIETLKLCRKLKEKNLNLENDEHLSA